MIMPMERNAILATSAEVLRKVLRVYLPLGRYRRSPASEAFMALG